MEKNLKQENKEIMDEVSKNPQTVRVSNPIAKNSAPDVIEKKKVPARRKKTTAASPSKISELKPAISNPLTRDSGIVARINNFTVSKTSN